MTSPTDDRLIDAAFDVLERVFTDRKRIKNLLRRAHARDQRGGSAEPDGMRPSSGLDGSGGGPRVTVDEDEHGPKESIDLTGVEVAALSRMAARGDDELRKTLRDGALMLRTLADSAGGLLGIASRLETLNLDPKTLNRPRCYLCPKLTLDAERELNRHGQLFHVTVADRTVGVCRWARDQHATRKNAIDRALPGFADQTARLPNRDEINQHHDGHNVRVTP